MSDITTYLEELEQEYIQLTLAVLTDDVTVDWENLKNQNNRLVEIEKEIGQDKAIEWETKAFRLAKKSGYASGKPF